MLFTYFEQVIKPVGFRYIIEAPEAMVLEYSKIPQINKLTIVFVYKQELVTLAWFGNFCRLIFRLKTPSEEVTVLTK